MKYFLGLAFIVSLSKSQYCPSSAYIQCTPEGGTCSIPSNINEGYMSFGANGKFNLIPFTNYQNDNTNLEIICKQGLGDIVYGTVKHCCYIGGDTGFQASQYYGQINEGQSWQFQDYPTRTYGMRFGTGDRFIYRLITNAVGYCNTGFFSDPAPNIVKVCNQYSYDPPSNVPAYNSANWINCGNEGLTCTGLDTGTAHWVRFGNNDHYFIRLVVSSDGTIPCENSLFGDPDPGNRKFCWRAPSQYTFTGVAGKWSELQSCVGCGSNEYDKSVGVTKLTEKQVTDTWTTSISTKVSEGFVFEGADVTASVGYSVATSMKTAFSQTVTFQSKFTCNKDILYQWTMSATQNNGVSIESFGVQGSQLACLSTPLIPQCPPGFCSDSSCQTCTTSLVGSIYVDLNDIDLDLLDVPTVLEDPCIGTTDMFSTMFSTTEEDDSDDSQVIYKWEKEIDNVSKITLCITTAIGWLLAFIFCCCWCKTRRELNNDPTRQPSYFTLHEEI